MGNLNSFIAVVFSSCLFLSNFNVDKEQKYKNNLKIDEISHLNFSYKHNFSMKYDGKYTIFDNYNFPKITLPRTLKYTFSNKSESDFLLNILDRRDRDTMRYSCMLTMDKSGMSWTVKNDSANMTFKKRCQAIELPLYKGKQWKTFFEDKKTIFECISLDTTIVTPLGSMKAFAIKTTLSPETKKDETYYLEIIEYYNVDLGKICSESKSWKVNTNTEKLTRLAEERLLISWHSELK